MQKQRKGREVLFSAALRDGLAGPISKAVSKALLACIRGSGGGWRGFVNGFGRRQLHRVLFREGYLVERSIDVEAERIKISYVVSRPLTPSGAPDTMTV